MDDINVDQFLDQIHPSDFGKPEYTYEIGAQVIKALDIKASEYEAAAKKLKAKRDEIKEVIRLRMIEEKLESCATEFGKLKPKVSEKIVTKNFGLFLDWLAEDKSRLQYLTQSCYNKTKMKQMHADSDDLLPPGLGVYLEYSLSITKK